MIRMTETVKGPRRAVTLPRIPDAIEAALRKHAEKDESWDTTLLHASDLSASSVIADERDRKCARSLKLRLLGTDETPPTPGDLLMFDQGHALHVRLAALLEEGFKLTGQGWHVAFVEYRVTEDLPGEITGTLDLMLYGPNGERVVVDWKTKRGRAFQFLDAAKDSNVLQVQSYMMAEKADAGIIVYVDREGTNFCLDFSVMRDDERVVQAQLDIEAIKASPEVPPILTPDYKLKEQVKSTAVLVAQPWQCDWCRFKGGACPGAVKDDDAGKVAGHVSERVFTPREGFEAYAETLASKLERDGVIGELPEQAESTGQGWAVGA
jgi:hypothetical protein